MAQVFTSRHVLLVAVAAGWLVTMGQARARGAHGSVALPISGVFVVDQSNSTMSASGALGSSPIQPQGPGSLTTSYSGTIMADLDLDAGTILFRPETAIAAADSGSWQPRRGGVSGSEPANYGGQAVYFFTILAALRDGIFSTLTDQPLLLTPVGEGVYSFESTQRVTALSGTFDYNASAFGSGSLDITGFSTQNTAPPGALQDFGDGTFGLTVPVDFTLNTTVSGVPLTIHLVGSIAGLAMP